MATEAPSYSIETLNDLVQVVTADNVESLANDLGDFLHHMVLAKGLTEIRNPGSGTPNVVLTWTDDGMRNCKTVVQPFSNSNEHFTIRSQPTPAYESLFPSE